MRKKYKHFISLGYFCSPAMKLGKIGLRDCSSPFDWCISDIDGVYRCIKGGFQSFLDYKYSFQNKTYHRIYKNIYYGIEFYHDFDAYKALDLQLESVKIKYERRIRRFYQNIHEPTFFIRYISAENCLKESEWLQENYKELLRLLKSYNRENELLFVANSDLLLVGVGSC